MNARIRFVRSFVWLALTLTLLPLLPTAKWTEQQQQQQHCVCVGEKESTKNVTVHAKLTLPSHRHRYRINVTATATTAPPTSRRLCWVLASRILRLPTYLYFCFRLNLLWTHKSNIYISKLTSSTRGRNSNVFLSPGDNLQCKLNRQTAFTLDISVCVYVYVCVYKCTCSYLRREQEIYPKQHNKQS